MLVRRSAAWRALLCLALAVVCAAQADLGDVAPGRREIHAAAFGDWGNPKFTFYKDVAQAVARRHGEQRLDFVLLLGDNFYNRGVKSVDDPLWKRVWEDAYGRMGIPFFVTLGNHDYLGNEQAQVDYSQVNPNWRLPARYYTFTAGPARFYALDTVRWDRTQAAWLAQELKKPAAWKIVFAHHPIFSYGRHKGERKLLGTLWPMIREAGVDLYLAGHEHEMQHIARDGIQFLINGGGGTKLRAVRAGRDTAFALSSHGLLELVIEERRLVFRFLDTALKTRHQQTLGK
jgi:predicted phosphodiesterase